MNNLGYKKFQYRQGFQKKSQRELESILVTKNKKKCNFEAVSGDRGRPQELLEKIPTSLFLLYPLDIIKLRVL